MNKTDRLLLLKRHREFRFSLIPLKPRSKIPFVKWKEYRLNNKDFLSFLARDINWAIRCDENFHALDFDDIEVYTKFIQEKGEVFKDAPVVHTGRGYHIWFKPRKPVSSFSVNGVEVKGRGSMVVAPPSIHPSGVEYYFEKAPNGKLPEIDIEELLCHDVLSWANQEQLVFENAPSDFALRYGKSLYPQSMCGKATRVFTRSDGKVKHMVSLRCWKWYCPKCAPLLKRYWLGKLSSLSFRFILRLPSVAKPTAFLRHVAKPDYVHIVANGESWLFLTDSEAEKVWAEARRVGYELVAGDVASDPTPEQVRHYLEQALCCEEKPLNTKRKITHSRRLFQKISQNNESNESKRKYDCDEEKEPMSAVFGEEPLTWDSEVVMKPIDEVAKELETRGWHVLWRSEVEALAIKGEASGCKDMDIVKLMESLGIKLKKVGAEYVGLCPFHGDHNPSLSVNREKGLWHCFGCGRGGDIHRFVEEWQTHGE